LANYAKGTLNQNRMFSYVDSHFPQDGLYGITEHWLYQYDPWAKIDITQGLFPMNNSGGNLTKTLIHEAAHGLYGWDDSTGDAEAVAQRCYQ